MGQSTKKITKSISRIVSLSLINLMFFTMCSDDQHEELYFVRKYYPSGNLKLEGYCRGSDSIRTGKFKFYHKSGFVEALVEYKNDMVEGNYLEFYPDGGIKFDGFYIRNEKVGEQIDYFFNGRVRRYSVYDYLHHLRYMEVWDSTGVLVSREGRIMSQVFLGSHKEYDSVRVSDTVSLSYIIAKPKDVGLKLFYNDSRNIDHLIHVPMDSVKNAIYHLPLVYDKIGKYCVTMYVRNGEGDNSIIINDSIKSCVEVGPK